MNIKGFIQSNVRHCIAFTGLAFIGFLGYKAIRWMINKCQQTKKIEAIASHHLSYSFPSSNHPTSPKNIHSIKLPVLKENQDHLSPPLDPVKTDNDKEKEIFTKLTHKE